MSEVEYHFVQPQVDRVIQFFEKHVYHVAGDWYGKPFDLMEYQVEEVIRPLFGWRIVDPDEPDEMKFLRRYRRVGLFVAKGNGKSPLLSGLGLFFVTADDPAAEVYSVAGDTTQAGITFGDAKEMAKLSPALDKRLKPYRQSLVNQSRHSVWRVLSSEAGTKHGFRPHAILFDELHVQRDRELWDTLIQGTGKRRQPVTIWASTAGHYDPDSICYEQYQLAKGVLEGRIEKPDLLPVIYELEKEDDWADLEVLRKANPALGITVSESFLEGEIAEAKEVPAKQNTFMRLHGNVWTEQVTRWLDMAVWNKNDGDVVEEELIGTPCWGGLDLSSTNDLTALVLVFKDGARRKFLPFGFIPEDRIAERVRRDKVPYDAWVRDGYLTATPGSVVDYGFVYEKVLWAAETFELRLLGYDRFNSSQLVNELQEELGEDVLTPVGQGYVSFATPCQDMDRLLREENVDHGGHPVFRSHAANVAVSQDAAGNFKPTKDRSFGRIDLLVAALMALGLAEADLMLDAAPTIMAVG